MPRILSTAFLAAALAASAASAAFAQMSHEGHPAPAADSPSSAAYAAAAGKMHADMGAELTGDADVDFARGMIPHHQGAIDMARIELEYGKDPELRGLAERIIAAQKEEIAFLEAWLAANAP